MDIANADGRPNVGGAGELRYKLRNGRRIAEVVESRQTVNLEQAGRIQHGGHPEDVGGFEIQGAHQELFNLRGGVFFDFEPNGGAALALADFFFNGFEQILDFVVVDFVLGVARHPEHGRVIDFHSREQFTQVETDGRLQRGERKAFLGGQRHESRQNGGDLDHCEKLLRMLRTLQDDGKIQGLVEQMRKRVSRIDCQRRQHGKDFRAKDFAQALAIGIGEFF